ncbi:MAG: hypothetical protein K6B46_05485 [Opitutales bacterium]|nr:hypothetical protein [Opitutales bacterium]
MKITKNTILTSSSILIASALAAHAGTGLYDTANWHGYRSNATVSFTADETSITASGLDKDSYIWGFLDEAIVLGVGETLTVSGTANLKSVNSGSAFYFGLYNSGSNRNTTEVSSIATATWDMTGFFSGPKDGDAVSKVYSRYNAKSGAGFMTTNQGAAYIASENLSSALTMPVAGTDYAFSMTITRNAADYTIGLNGETVVFTTEKSFAANSFDTIAFKSTGTGISLSGLSLELTSIPEPSAFGFLAGTLALLFAGTRRRRR